jgi:hypothetical protein
VAVASRDSARRGRSGLAGVGPGASGGVWLVIGRGSASARGREGALSRGLQLLWMDAGWWRGWAARQGCAGERVTCRQRRAWVGVESGDRTSRGWREPDSDEHQDEGEALDDRTGERLHRDVRHADTLTIRSVTMAWSGKSRPAAHARGLEQTVRSDGRRSAAMRTAGAQPQIEAIVRLMAPYAGMHTI